MPGESVMLARIAVDRCVWFFGKRRLDLGLRSLGNELVFLGQMHQHGPMKPIDLSQIFVSVTAVISDRSVDAVAQGCQRNHRSAEPRSVDRNLASASPHPSHDVV